MENLGSANIGLTIDLEGLRSSLKQAFTDVRTATDNIGKSAQIKFDPASIRTATAQVATQLKTVETQAKETSASVQNLGTAGGFSMTRLATTMGLTMFTAAGLAMEVRRLGEIGVREFLESDKAANLLLFSLKENSEEFERLNKFADEWMKKTIFDDEEIQNAAAFLAGQQRSVEQIEAMTKAAMNLQAVKGGDLMTWVQQLDTMMETGMLPRSISKLDKDFRGLTQTQIGNGEVIDMINDKYSGYAEKMGTTYSGKLEIFGNKFKNVLGDMVSDIMKFIDSLPAFGNEVVRFMGNLANDIAGIARTMGEFWNSIPIIGGLGSWMSSGVEKVAGDFGEHFEETAKLFDIKNQGLIGPPVAPKKRETGDDFKPTTTGTGTKKEEFKEETSALDELIRKHENELKLAGDNLDTRLELLTTYKAELEAAGESLVKAENKVKAEDKTVDLKKQINDLEKQIADNIEKQKKAYEELKAQVDSFIKDREDASLTGIDKEVAGIRKAYEKLFDDLRKMEAAGQDTGPEKARLEEELNKEISLAKLMSETNAEQELSKLKLQNLNKDHSLKVRDINDKYKRESDRIKKEYGESVLTNQLLKQLEIARIKELQAIRSAGEIAMTTAFNAGMQTVMGAMMQGFGNVWTSVFGQANSLFEQFVQTVITKLIEIAAMEIFKAIITVVTGGAGGGAMGAIGAIFQTGGYTGEGPEGELAGGVHFKEFVLNPIATASTENIRLAEMMNRGIDVGEMMAGIEARSAAPMADFSRVLGSYTPDEAAPLSGINLNLGGIGIKARIQSLKLTENEWNMLIDNDVVPQISKALKRAGKDVLDSTIKRK